MSRNLPESPFGKCVDRIDSEGFLLSLINDLLILDIDDLYEVRRIISLKSEEIRTKEQTYEAKTAS